MATMVCCLCLTMAALAGAVARSEGATVQPTKEEVGKVNINTASAEQLESLPGIGPKIAQRIIIWRKENGKFQKIEDILAVKGIGEKKYARLKELITVE
ncbi:MAG: ComEA family DNA-binding protein [Acidobacteria bacterium]|nr:ComEA family DNA-binding protein [Acidobacteriota bacterium]